MSKTRFVAFATQKGGITTVPLKWTNRSLN